MVDQEIRVLGDENIIANPKNSQKQYPLTFKAVPNVIVYGRKKADLNFTVPIAEGTNFNFNLERTAIIFSDSFNLEEYSYIMVKNPFEEISDFFYVSSLEELDPTGKEFNEFNDEVVKWLRRLVNIISNRCMIFETTLFKDLNNFPNIKTGQTFIRTEDGWTGITIRDINSELDLIFNKYVEEINKKIQEHQVKMNELLEQWKQDIQKYAENVKQYEIVRIVTQTGHGFVFEPVMYSISQRKFVKAVFPHGADGIAVRVDDNNFRLVWAGRVEIPATAKDTQQRDFVLGEYYFLGEGSNGGIQREKPDTYYQHLFQVMYSDELRQNIADILLSVPINQKGKRWDVGEAKTSVNDIEELKVSDFLVGKVIEVLGYYKAGDGADHKRIISDTDDGSGVQLNNGLWANIVHNGEVNVSWFGIKNEDDITTNIQKILNLKNIKITVNKGNYSLSDKIRVYNNTVLDFCNSVLNIKKDYSSIVLGDYEIGEIENVTIKNVIITSDNKYHCNIVFMNGKKLIFENITFKDVCNSYGHNIDMGGGNGITISNCNFLGKFKTTDDDTKEFIQLDYANKTGIPNYFSDNANYSGNGVKNLLIKNCFFNSSLKYTNDKQGACIGSHGAIQNKNHENIVIENNIFIGERFSSFIHILNWKNVKIKNNFFDFYYSNIRSYQHSIYFDAYENYLSENIDISHNKFKGNYLEQIPENDKHKYTIFGEYKKNKFSYKNVNIENNNLELFSSDFDNYMIGIMMKTTNCLKIINNTIIGNGYNTVAVLSSENFEISKNYCETYTGVGITVSADTYSGDEYNKNCIISENILKSSNEKNRGKIMYANKTSNAIILGNNTEGIYLEETTNNSVITNNIIKKSITGKGDNHVITNNLILNQ